MPSPAEQASTKLLLVALVTLVLALAFGADLGGDDELGYAEWRKQAEEQRGSGWLPWNESGHRRLDDATEAKLRLADERRRRIQAEESLSQLRTRMSEMTANEETLRSTVRELERRVAEQDQELLDLRAAVARASAASPEVADRFITMADEALRAARFEKALELLDEAEQTHRALLRPDPGQRARLEFVRATALVALGDEAAAARSLARLLDASPDFAIDAANSSPKLLRVLDRVLPERNAIARATEPPAAE